MSKLFPILMMAVLFASSCSNPCEDVICLNGGVCDDGTCICPEGFTGDNCQLAAATACDTVVCFNGGVCIDGACLCPSGYTGTNCEIEVQADPCDTIVCLNGGTCITGNCNCADGYEGTTCETVERQKFLGLFSVIEECNPGTYVYDINITAGTTIDRINVANFGGYGVVVYGVVDGTSVVFPQQSNEIGGFSGNGSIVGNILTVSYTVNLGISSFDCVMTCTR